MIPYDVILQAVLMGAMAGALIGGGAAYFIGYRDGRTETRLKQAKPMLRRVK